MATCFREDGSSERLNIAQANPYVEVLQRSCNRFPEANGLSIAISNQTSYTPGNDSPNIHNSSKKISLAMRNLGFATCTLKNCSIIQIFLVFKAVLEIYFWPSFKSIFIYLCGHGYNGHFKTTNGNIKINSLLEILCSEKKKEKESWENMVKVLFCDCCRTVDRSSVQVVEREKSGKNLLFAYAAPLGNKSYLIVADGLSIATRELLKLLLRQKRCRLESLLLVDLSRSMEAAGLQFKVGQLHTEIFGCLSRHIDFYGDKLMAMSPREVMLEENYVEDTCIITWKKPLHIDHYRFLGYSIKSIMDENGNYLRSDIVQTSVCLSRSRVCDKRLSVCARYHHWVEVGCSTIECVSEDLLVDGCSDGDCEPMSLKSETIVPDKVRVIVAPSGTAQLVWNKPVSLQSGEYKVSIQRAPTDNIDDEGSWKFIAECHNIENSRFDLDKTELCIFEYRMRVHDECRTSRWIRAYKEESVAFFYQQHLNKKRFASVMMLVTIPICVFLVAAVMTSMMSSDLITSGIVTHDMIPETTLYNQAKVIPVHYSEATQSDVIDLPLDVLLEHLTDDRLPLLSEIKYVV